MANASCASQLRASEKSLLLTCGELGILKKNLSCTTPRLHKITCSTTLISKFARILFRFSNHCNHHYSNSSSKNSNHHFLKFTRKHFHFFKCFFSKFYIFVLIFTRSNTRNSFVRFILRVEEVQVHAFNARYSHLISVTHGGVSTREELNIPRAACSSCEIQCL